MLRAYGNLAIPYLMRSLTPEGHTKKTKIRWNIHGSDRVLELLGETRSTEVIPILEQAIQNRVYSHNHSSLEARLSTFLTWTLLLSGIGFYFDIVGGVLLFCFIALCIFGVQSIEHVDDKNHTQHSAWKALLLIPDRSVLFSLLPFVEKHGYLESLEKRDFLALSETLRQADEAFAAELNAEQREGLHALLETKDQTLLEAVVYTLGYAGNRTTLYFLKDIYAKHKNVEFKQQIRLAHERITARLTRQKENKELLRASSLQDDPQILLRPSQESHDPQEQLLRPSEREK